MDSLNKPIEEIFSRALRFDNNRRCDFLRRACKNHPNIQREVEALLLAARESEAFFDDFFLRVQGIPHTLSELHATDFSNTSCSKVGPWNVVALLGEGGMGRVYKVERDDGQYHQLAALKILPITAHTSMAKFRFREERQILAGLNHKHIVQLLDGGVTTEGQPYFVMEYVDGWPIDEYCQRTTLDIPSRLQLFLDVCHAVQYAHNNMVIHRDLKPSNIFVNDHGDIKLLDFGIAKLLGDNLVDNTVTLPGFRHLTPAYASPQMLRGEGVDVRTDVYSLGVVLHKLLCGTKPYENSENAAQLISFHSLNYHELPKQASLLVEQKALQRQLRGDLDNILQKALAINADLRYVSVSNFAKDIHAYLNGFPVEASSGKFFYKAKKFFTRHLYINLFVLLSIATVFTASYFYINKQREAQYQRNSAYYQQQRAVLANDFITVILNKIGLSNRAMSVESLLHLAESLAEEKAHSSPSFSGWLLFEISMKYELMPLNNRAIEAMKKAENLARQQKNTDLLKAILCTQANRNFYLNPALALQQADSAVKISLNVPPSIESEIACAISAAKKQDYFGDTDGALDILERTIEKFSTQRASQSTVYFRLFHVKGLILYHKKRYLRALNNNRQLLQVMRAAGHENTTHYFTIQGNRAIALQAMGDLQEATSIREKIISQSSHNSQIPKHIWVDHAYCLNLLGRYQDAEKIFAREFMGTNSSAIATLAKKKQVHLHIGYMYSLLSLGKTERAGQHFENAKEIIADFHRKSKNQHIFLEAEFIEAILFKKRGMQTKGDNMLQVLLEKIIKTNRPVNGLLLRGYFQSVSELIERGDADHAEKIALNLLNMMPALDKTRDRSGDIGLLNLLLGKIYNTQGRHREARDKIHAAARQLTRGYGPNHPYTALLATLNTQLKHSRKQL